MLRAGDKDRTHTPPPRSPAGAKAMRPRPSAPRAVCDDWQETRRWSGEMAQHAAAMTFHAGLVIPHTIDAVAGPLVSAVASAAAIGPQVVFGAMGGLVGMPFGRPFDKGVATGCMIGHAVSHGAIEGAYRLGMSTSVATAACVGLGVGGCVGALAWTGGAVVLAADALFGAERAGDEEAQLD